MIKYICKNCNDLECETSICPICNNRASLVSTEIFYDVEKNVPSFYEDSEGEKCLRIGTDVRPIFAQERLFIEVLIGKPMEYAGKSVWATKSNTYWVDGCKHTLDLKKLRQKNPDEVIEQLEKYKEMNQPYVDSDFENEHIRNFIEVNRFRLNSITEEASQYIKNISDGYDMSSIFVSFSGGKDSTVTSSLVMNALGTEKVMHIYGDTTLEYPTSKEYITEFRKKYPATPLLTAKNKDQDFNDLVDVVGPPSRVMRWCCTVFKTGAITKKIEQTFQNKTRILSFQGIRRSESSSRSKYERDSAESKIAKQIAASPIIDWLDFDVWLYILANKLPFNGAYRQGFSRVGCWCCPNNSSWSEFMASVFMPEQYKAWKEQLYSFARKVGKEDWKVYVDEGNWKARQGGNGLSYSQNTVVSFKPCALEENSYNFELVRPISKELYTFFKPFGNLNFTLGNKRLGEVYVLDRKTETPLLKLTGKEGAKVLRITVLNKTGKFKFSKVIEQLLNAQITKYQMCIGCGYCQSVCRFNALKVFNTKPGDVSNESIAYRINENMCVGCTECVTHFDGGCYMKKVLRVKKGA